MSTAEPAPWFVWIFIAVFFGIWFWNVYLMLFRPASWIEWFLAKPYRGMGVSVSVVDGKKLRSRTRLPAIVFLLGGLFFLIVFVSGALSGR